MRPSWRPRPRPQPRLRSRKRAKEPDGDRRGHRAARRADRRGREALRPPLVVRPGRDQPDPGRGRRGPLLLGLRRQALPRLRLAARQRLDRAPAPEDRRRDQGAGRPALHDRPADGDRAALGARAPARRGHARRPRDVVLHERRRRGERERDQARALVHGPAARSSRATARTTAPPRGAITLTGDPRRWPAEPGIPGVVRMLDPYTYRCPAGHPDPCPVCTGAPHLEEILQYEGAAHRRRGDPRDGRRARTASSSRPTATCSRSARSATGTGSCSSATR